MRAARPRAWAAGSANSTAGDGILKTLLAAGVAAAFALAAAGSASATSDLLMTVTFSDGTFNDGGAFSGSFVFDLTTDDFVNWDVTTTAGSIQGGFTYTSSDPSDDAFAAGAGAFGHVVDSFHDGVFLNLMTPTNIVTNPSGVLEGEEVDETDCADSCVQEDVRTVTGGTFTTTFSSSVPEPTSWALMILGVGFAGTALRRRRRMARA
jgi:hypothetical protein